MHHLAQLFNLRNHCEIRVIVNQDTTEIQAWTHPKISDARQTLMAQANNTNTELAALSLMDQLATPG